MSVHGDRFPSGFTLWDEHPDTRSGRALEFARHALPAGVIFIAGVFVAAIGTSLITFRGPWANLGSPTVTGFVIGATLTILASLAARAYRIHTGARITSYEINQWPLPIQRLYVDALRATAHGIVKVRSGDTDHPSLTSMERGLWKITVIARAAAALEHRIRTVPGDDRQDARAAADAAYAGLSDVVERYQQWPAIA